MRTPDGRSGDGAAGHYTYLGDDPATVGTLVETLTRRGADTTALAESVADQVPRMRSAWREGEAADKAFADVERARTFAASVPSVLTGGATALEAYHGVLTTSRRVVDSLNTAYAVLSPVQSRVETFGDWIEPQDGASYEKAWADLELARSRSGFSSLADIDGAYAGTTRTVTGARDECGVSLQRLSRQGQAPGGRAGTSAFAGMVTAGTSSLEDLLARQGLSSVPQSPEGVKEFWDQLSPSERQRLLVQDPGRWGNTNGLPTLDRDVANRSTLASEKSQFEAFFREHGVEPPTSVKDIEQLRTWELDALGLYRGLTIFKDARVEKLLSRYKDVLSTEATVNGAARGKVPAYLLTFDSQRFDGEGRVAIAFGNPDTADNIGISVPGLESRASKMDQVGGDARHLYDEAKQADPAHATSMIAWQGYDAPEFSNVASQDKAKAGAGLLSGDVHALNVTHHGDPRITMVAHSYGSTTTGIALQHNGLAHDVDQVIFIGSPGVGSDARNVSDLGLRDDQLFVGSSSRDRVTTTFDGLGHNPVDDSFGGTRFKAENVNRNDGANLSFADHSLYYDKGTHSESLYNMADIVSGHPERLGPDGMIAGKRHTEVYPNYAGGPAAVVTEDAERDRTPTQGHQH